MRRRKRFVQVHVNDIETHVSRSDLAANRIEVRAVIVEQAAGVPDDPLDFDDLPLENPERRRIGQHDPRRSRTDDGLEGLDVDIAVGLGRDFPADTTAHRGRRRIRTVRRIGDDDFIPVVVAAGLVIGTDHRDAGQFALRSRHRRQRYALHTGYGLEHLLQFVHAAQESLGVADRTERVPATKLGQQRERIADSRVVFHRAGTERIKLRVDREVLLRQARVVPDDLQFGDLG